MAEPAEVAPPPLQVEGALERITAHRQHRENNPLRMPPVEYPARLGPLAVAEVQYDPVDGEFVVNSAVRDFEGSYGYPDAATGAAVRERVLGWVDWVAWGTRMDVQDYAHLRLASHAATQGDVAMVRQIIEDPRRLWFDSHSRISSQDPDYGRLDRQPTHHILNKLSLVAGMLNAGPEESASAMHEAVLPTVANIVPELAQRDLSDDFYKVSTIVNQLVACGTPEALSQADVLVAALPMTPGRLDFLVELGQKTRRYEAETDRMRAWHSEQTMMAREILSDFLRKPLLSPTREVIDLEGIPSSRSRTPTHEDGTQEVARRVGYYIPEGEETSAIETSLAYMVDSWTGVTVHGDILGCVRKLLHNPRFEFANPRFGFSARFENGPHSYAHGTVVVVDENLPEGRTVLNLGQKPLTGNHESALLLCRMIQAEKDQRAGAS